MAQDSTVRDSNQIQKVQKRLHWFSIGVASCVLLLITVGGLVNSAGAGLSVPDWPTTYGENMFLFPLHKWKGGIVYEHGHRLLASLVGFLIVLQFLGVWIVERQPERRWVRYLSLAAVGAVIVQGILGGLTVLYQLPPEISISHSLLAESLFLLTILLAVVTDPRFPHRAVQPVHISGRWQKFLGVVVAALFIQIFLGALTRHTHSGLAIPDFPLAYGALVPEFSDYHITIHYIHRVGAFIVGILILIASWKLWRHRAELPRLRLPAIMLSVLLVVQIFLGGGIVWSYRDILITTLHVGVGAAMLGLSFLQYLLLRFYYAPSNASETAVSATDYKTVVANAK